ncbi:unnamed protein product [Orchesella dallaii]|uniref:Uncharacterized protein n=1 Tax=Orchesella dallaii TaxID=48710 RepID=A0ABP1R201_9HEXA
MVYMHENLIKECSLRTKVKTRILKPRRQELVVGNEESGQASPSSTTTVAKSDNAADNDESHNSLPWVANDTNFASDNDIANISPYEDSDNNEHVNDDNGDDDDDENRPPNAGTEGGGGSGDWFGNGRNNPHGPETFFDFFKQFMLAAAIAILILLASDLINGIFQLPGTTHKLRKRRLRKRIRIKLLH